MAVDLRDFPNIQGLADEPTLKSSGKPNPARQIVQLAEEAEFFHTPEKDPYATIYENGIYRTFLLSSKEFKEWLLCRFFLTYQKPVSSQALFDALATLEARANCLGPQHQVFTRIGMINGAVYLDLATEAGQVVKITAEGWEVLTANEIRFRRSPNMRPLPLPVKHGSMASLYEFINVHGSKDKYLLVAWLLGALNPNGPYPVLILQGEQGSAKSTVARLLRELIDPYTPAHRSLPRSEQDLIIGSKRSWIQSYDNISSLSADMSDALCRLSTGGGFGTRRLYHNEEEVLFSIQRPVILNGITDFATRQDLIDRTIILHLAPIPLGTRLTEGELLRQFQKAHPAILGELCDASSMALRRSETVNPPNLPRHADWAKWVEAAAPALGWPSQGFLDAYLGHRQETVELSMEWDLVAQALTQFLETIPSWQGTATQLLADLKPRIDDEQRRSRAWPANAKALSDRLHRIAPALRSTGIGIHFKRLSGGNRPRLIIINKDKGTCVPCVPPQKAPKIGEAGVASTLSSPISQEKESSLPFFQECQTPTRDERDARDAKSQPPAVQPASDLPRSRGWPSAIKMKGKLARSNVAQLCAFAGCDQLTDVEYGGWFYCQDHAWVTAREASGITLPSNPEPKTPQGDCDNQKIPYPN